MAYASKQDQKEFADRWYKENREAVLARKKERLRGAKMKVRRKRAFCKTCGEREKLRNSLFCNECRQAYQYRMARQKKEETARRSNEKKRFRKICKWASKRGIVPEPQTVVVCKEYGNFGRCYNVTLTDSPYGYWGGLDEFFDHIVKHQEDCSAPINKFISEHPDIKTMVREYSRYQMSKVPSFMTGQTSRLPNPFTEREEWIINRYLVLEDCRDRLITYKNPTMCKKRLIAHSFVDTCSSRYDQECEQIRQKAIAAKRQKEMQATCPAAYASGLLNPGSNKTRKEKTAIFEGLIMQAAIFDVVKNALGNMAGNPNTTERKRPWKC